MPYRESLRPNPGTFLAIALIGPAAWLVASPLSPEFAIIISVAVLLMAVMLALVSVPKIKVENSTLTAGRIRIGLEHLGEIQTLCGQDRQQSMGVGLDARAKLCTSPWVDCVLKVEVSDESDPVPYLMLSTRHPKALTLALKSMSSE